MPAPLLALALGLGIGEAQDRRQEKQAEAQQRQRGRGAVDLATGSGLPVGPRVDTTPAEQQQLGGITRGMASPFEDVREQAFDQLASLSPKAQMDLEKLRLGNDKTALEIKAMQDPSVVTDPKFMADIANQLRDERAVDMKPFEGQLRLFDDINSLLQPAMAGGLQTGPAAMNILFRYIKGLDDSVVRPSEAEALRGGTGVANQFVSLYNEILGQGMITPQIAQQMFDAASIVAQQQQAAAQDVMQMHNEQAAVFLDQFAFGQNFLQMTGSGRFRERAFDSPTIAPGSAPDPAEQQSAAEAIPGFVPE